MYKVSKNSIEDEGKGNGVVVSSIGIIMTCKLLLKIVLSSLSHFAAQNSSCNRTRRCLKKQVQIELASVNILHMSLYTN